MGLEVVDELVKIVGKSLYCTLKFLANFGDCLNDTIKGRLKDFGYKNMWTTLIYHNLSPNPDHERLQIGRKHRCSFIDQI